jgi:hypothetical protein
MPYRDITINREVRDHLEEALERRKLAFQLGFRHFEAIRTVVELWDRSPETETLIQEEM